MRPWVSVLMVGLALSPSFAQAHHERPDESASWDVVATARLGAADDPGRTTWIWNPPAHGFLPSGDVLVGFGRDAGLACRFLVLAGPDWIGESHPLADCDRPLGIGIAAVVDGMAIGCTHGTPADAPVAFGIDIATRATQWVLTPQSIDGRAGTWGCGRAATIGGDIVLPLWGRASTAGAVGGLDGEEALTRFVRLGAANGTVRWAQQVSAASIATDSVGLLGYDDLLDSPSLQPLGVAVAGEGFVATADLGDERILLQLRDDGEFRGVLRQSMSPYGRPGVAFSQTTVDTRDAQTAVDDAWGAAPGHVHAASDGVVAYVGWGTTLLAVDAFASRPLASVQLDAALGTAHPFLGPTISQAGAVVVPMTYGVAMIDPATMTVLWQRTFPQVFAGGVWDVQVAADGNVLAVADDTRSRLQLHVLDATSGDTLQQLAVPIAPSERFFADKVHVTPLPTGDGAVIWERTGPMALLGHRSDQAPLPLGDAYPAPLHPVTLSSVPARPGLVGRIAWGDSTVTPLAPGATVATHAYQDAGVHVARWTWQDPETGLTWSSSASFDVGGSPPPELNFLQRAFSDQNRDMTWGIIGLVLAAFSGIGAVAAATWRRRGLAADLRRLDAMRALGATDPATAAAELRDYRRGLRERAAKGVVQGGEFASLSHEAVALAQSLQRRALARFEGRIDHHLRAMLDAAMADGMLSPAESDRIGSALQGELGLTPAERTDIARLLGVWT